MNIFVQTLLQRPLSVWVLIAYPLQPPRLRILFFFLDLGEVETRPRSCVTRNDSKQWGLRLLLFTLPQHRGRNNLMLHEIEGNNPLRHSYFTQRKRMLCPYFMCIVWIGCLTTASHQSKIKKKNTRSEWININNNNNNVLSHDEIHFSFSIQILRDN